MDAFHERLARVALAHAADAGFCLAGGYAVQAYGFLKRASEDVDLFTTADAEARWPQAVADFTAYGLIQTDVAALVERAIDWGRDDHDRTSRVINTPCRPQYPRQSMGRSDAGKPRDHPCMA